MVFMIIMNGSLCEISLPLFQTGPAKLIWPNGAVREGRKVRGQWEGEVVYTYAEGPRKGKKDKETWSNGKLVSSQKIYKQVCRDLFIANKVTRGPCYED
jgi:hypothetical protein